MKKTNYKEKFIEKAINNNIKDIIPLEAPVGTKEKTLFYCAKHNIIWFSRSDAILKGCGCYYCSIEKRKEKVSKTHEQFLKELSSVFPNITAKDYYIANNVHMMFECEKGHVWSTAPSTILKGHGCPICGYLKSEEESLYVLRPDLIKYFKKEDREALKSLPIYTAKKFELVCPDCGAKKEMKVISLSSNGFSCPICSDGIKRPNKLLRSFTKRLPVKDLEFEYVIKIEKHRYFFDCSFWYGEIHFLIEMDGCQHKEGNMSFKQTSERTRKNDKIKNRWALENNCLLIRIDCDYILIEDIVKNILNSRLKDFFNLEKIDWDKCLEEVASNLMKEVCLYYKNNKNITYKQLGEIFNLSPGTVSNYINFGEKVGWCNSKKYNIFSDEKDIEKKKRPISIICYEKETNNKIGEFSSMTACANYLTNELNYSISNETIRKRIHGKLKREKDNCKYLFKIKESTNG